MSRKPPKFASGPSAKTFGRKVMQTFGLAAAATSASAASSLYGHVDPEVFSWAATTGQTAATSLASFFIGVLGNSVSDRLNQRNVDYDQLFENHDLHRLTGNAVGYVIGQFAVRTEDLDPVDAKRLGKLADAIIQEWDLLGSTDGFREAVHGLSKVELMHWYSSAADADPGSDRPAQALEPGMWSILFTAVGKRHDCLPAADVLRQLCDETTLNLPHAVRQLLKEDFASDEPGTGYAYAGYVIKMLSEIHACAVGASLERGVLAEELGQSRQQLKQLSSDIQQISRMLAERSPTPVDERVLKRIDQQHKLVEEIHRAVGQAVEEIGQLRQENRIDHEETRTLIELIQETNGAGIEKILSKLEENGLPRDHFLASAPEDNGEADAALEPLSLGAAKGLVARKSQQGMLQRALFPKKRPQTISPVCLKGMAGVGKTFLVEHFLDTRWKPHYGDKARIGWVLLSPDREGNYPDCQTLLAELAAQLQINAANAKEQLAALQTIFAWGGGNLLVVENVDDDRAAQVAGELLGRLPGIACIITGRVDNVGGGKLKTITVEQFDVEDGLRQFKKDLGRHYKQYDESQLRELVRQLGGLPLAIHLAAGHLASGDDTPAEFLEQLRDSGLTLQPADADNARLTRERAKAILQTSFDISWRAFAAACAGEADEFCKALASLAHAPLEGVGDSLGAAMAGMESARYRRLCNRAQRFSLLTIRRDESRLVDTRICRFHTLMREFLAKQLESPETIDRISDWFIARLPETNIEPGQRRTSWYEIRDEMAALIAWLSVVPDDLCYEIILGAVKYSIRNGPYHIWRQFCERGLTAAEDAQEKSVFLWKLCQLTYNSGDLEQSLKYAHQKREYDLLLDDPRAFAVTMSHIADILLHRGELEDALRIYQQDLLPAFEKLDDVQARAVIFSRIAEILLQRGDTEESLRICREESLPVFDQIGDMRSKARTLITIARILAQRGKTEQALKTLKNDVLPVFEQDGDVRETAAAMCLIAELLYLRALTDDALVIFQNEVAPIFEQIGDIHSRAVTLGKIADILQQRGETEEALRIRREEELPVYEQIGDVRLRAVTIGKIADILLQQREAEKALQIYREEVLPAFEQVGDVRLRAATLGKIADIMQRRGEAEEALRIYREEVLPVYEKVGDVRARAVTLGKIADILQQWGVTEEVLRIRREEELPVYEQMGDVRARAVTLGKIADILLQRGDTEEALRIRREEELPVYEQVGDVRARAVTLGKIADILQQRGETEEVLRIRRAEQLPVFEQLGDVRSTLVTRTNLAIILMQRDTDGDREEAKTLLQQAREAAVKLQIPETVTIENWQKKYGFI